jgi:hypothetical protein
VPPFDYLPAQAGFSASLQKILGKQGDYFVFENSSQVLHTRILFQDHKEGMADGVFPIVQGFNTLVDGVQELINFYLPHYQPLQRTIIRHHLDKLKTAAQGRVHQGQGTVCRIHRADDMEICRDTKLLP